MLKTYSRFRYYFLWYFEVKSQLSRLIYFWIVLLNESSIFLGSYIAFRFALILNQAYAHCSIYLYLLINLSVAKLSPVIHEKLLWNNSTRPCPTKQFCHSYAACVCVLLWFGISEKRYRFHLIFVAQIVVPLPSSLDKSVLIIGISGNFLSMFVYIRSHSAASFKSFINRFGQSRCVLWHLWAWQICRKFHRKTILQTFDSLIGNLSYYKACDPIYIVSCIILRSVKAKFTLFPLVFCYIKDLLSLRTSLHVSEELYLN